MQYKNTGKFMEQHSAADVGMPESHRTLEGQLREMYGRVAYTHKTHGKMADGHIARYRLIKQFEIGLSALTTGSLLLAVFGDTRAATIIGAVCSTVLLAIVLYFDDDELDRLLPKQLRKR